MTNRLEIHLRPNPNLPTQIAFGLLIAENFPHAPNECSECRHVKRAYRTFMAAMEE